MVDALSHGAALDRPPQVSLAEARDETVRAVDPGKFAVWGDSAGGYMAAMLGATGDQPTVFDAPALGNAAISSAVQAVVVWFGAEDRLPSPELQIAHYLPTATAFPPLHDRQR